MNRQRLRSVLFVILAALPLSVSAAETGNWVALWQDAYHDMPDGSYDPERMFGLPAVDRTTGDVYLSLWDHGIWKSSDEGRTFSRVDGGKISGGGCGPILGCAFYIHPEGKRLVTFNMNNGPGPSGYSTDSGATWNSYEAVGRNWDFGTVGWETQTVFAARHEDDGLHLSSDQGKTWTRLAKPRDGVTGLAVIGKALLLAGTDGIERSDDDGKTWKPVDANHPSGPALEFAGKFWWLAPDAKTILVSADKGATWTAQGTPAPGAIALGPFFGKDENHVVLAGSQGFFETTDGCKTWQLAVPLPPDFNLFGAAFDPVHDIFYATASQKPVMKFVRGKKPEYTLPALQLLTPNADSHPKAAFVAPARVKVRCIVGSAATVAGNFLYVCGEDGIMYFKRDLQTGTLAFVEQIEELKSGGFTLASAGGRLYGVTPHDGYRRMNWHGLAWFEPDAQTGKPVKKGVVPCPASRQILVAPNQHDLYLKSWGEQKKIFWVHLADDGKPVLSGEVSGPGIGPSEHADYPGIFVMTADAKFLYTVSAKDYAIACIARSPGGEITYKNSTDLTPVTKAQSGHFQWISLAVSPDGAWLYAAVRQGKPTDNFYAIFKRDTATGALTFQETINGEQDALANAKGWNMVFAPDQKGGYLGNFAGPLLTFTYDAKSGHLTHAAVVHETTGNGTSNLAYDTANGILYTSGREYTYDQIFSLKVEK